VKIAISTNDGETISQHFGQAKQYLVCTLADGAIVAQELRAKPAHGHGDHGHSHDAEHGHGPEGQHTHAKMTEPIRDCDVLICGGMGRPAFEGVIARGIQPIVTDIRSIEQALAAYLAGDLRHQPERLH
jgi:predicted Fe-Mo cluster-binding NifX family protein